MFSFHRTILGIISKRASAPSPSAAVVESVTNEVLLFTKAYQCTLCLKKVPTFKLSVTLSNLNGFSKFLHYWKAKVETFLRHSVYVGFILGSVLCSDDAS